MGTAVSLPFSKQDGNNADIIVVYCIFVQAAGHIFTDDKYQDIGPMKTALHCSLRVYKPALMPV